MNMGMRDDDRRYVAMLEKLPTPEKDKIFPHIQRFGRFFFGSICLVLVTVAIGVTALQQRLEFLGTVASICSIGFMIISFMFSEKKLQKVKRMIDEATTRQEQS